MSTTVEYILDVDAKGAQAGLKKTGQAAKKTTKSIKSARMQARGLSGSFQAVGEAAGFMAPELAGLGEIALVGARSFRGFGRTLASGSPIIIGLTLAITAGIAAFAAFNAATKREEESQKALSKALEENTKKIKENQAAFDKSENAILSSAGKLNELRLQYAVLSGDISKAEAAETKRAFSAEQAAAKLETQLANQIQAKQNLLKTERENFKAVKKRITDLQKEGTFQASATKLTKKGLVARAEETAVLKNINKLEIDLRDLRIDGTKRIKAQADEFIKLQEKIS
ncbi:MAG: hypothetical protein AAF403_00890, partial [Pseudomonadota bacterium]